MITKIFEYVAVAINRDDEGREIKNELITNGIILAKNENSALLQIAKKIDASFDPDNVEISLRPF